MAVIKPYNETINLILSTLLYLTRKKVPSEKDSQRLYNKIIELMIRFYPLGSLLDEEVELEFFIDELKDPIPASVEKYAKKIGIDLKLRHDIAKYVTDFSKMKLLPSSNMVIEKIDDRTFIVKKTSVLPAD